MGSLDVAIIIPPGLTVTARVPTALFGVPVKAAEMTWFEVLRR